MATELKDMSAAADTCRRTAAVRALASLDPRHPYSEPLAEVLAGRQEMDTNRAWQAANKNKEKQEMSTLILRSMILDHWLVEEVKKSPNHGSTDHYQIVTLGAGMDTRPYRLRKKMQGATWYEVDQKDVITLKENVLKEHGTDPLNGGTAVVRLQLDLAIELDQLFPSLQANAFVMDAPTIFVMEGLLYYIHLEGIQKLFATLEQASNSIMFVTMIDHEMLEHVHNPRTENPLLLNVGKLWHTDLNDISHESVLGGWRIIGDNIKTSDEAWLTKLCPGWTLAGVGFFGGDERILRMEQ